MLRFLRDYWPQLLLGLVVFIILLDGLIFAGSGNPDCPSMPSSYC